jgi:hypothetical protein
MNTSIQDTAQARWEMLPSELREFYQNPQYAKNVQELIRTYGFNTSQSKILEDELMLVLFLFEPISQLKNSLARQLLLSEATATALMTEIEWGTLYTVMPILRDIAQNPEFKGVRSVRSEQQPAASSTPMQQNIQSVPVPVITRQAVGDPGLGQRPLTRDEVLQALAPRAPQQNIPPAPPAQR